MIADGIFILTRYFHSLARSFTFAPLLENDCPRPTLPLPLFLTRSRCTVSITNILYYTHNSRRRTLSTSQLASSSHRTSMPRPTRHNDLVHFIFVFCCVRVVCVNIVCVRPNPALRFGTVLSLSLPICLPPSLSSLYRPFVSSCLFTNTPYQQRKIISTFTCTQVAPVLLWDMSSLMVYVHASFLCMTLPVSHLTNLRSHTKTRAHKHKHTHRL